METKAAQFPAPLLGRDVELETLQAFSAPDPTGRALVIVGEPGIGKTSLWEAGLKIARAGGRRVLAARAVEAESALSFASLSDLFDGIAVTITGIAWGTPVSGSPSSCASSNVSIDANAPTTVSILIPANTQAGTVYTIQGVLDLAHAAGPGCEGQSFNVPLTVTAAQQ